MASVITSQRWSNLSEYLTLTTEVDANDVVFVVDDDSDLYAISGQEFLVASLGDSKTGEIVHIYELLGSNQCAVTRAQEGSTGQTWPAGTVINVRVTAGSLNAIVEAIGSAEDSIMALQALPDFSVMVRDTDQTISDDSETAVSLSSHISANNTLYDENEPTRLTATQTGTYWVHGAIEFAANATGYRQLAIKKNGSTVKVLNRVTNLGASFTTPVLVGSHIYLAQGDYVELYARHTAGGPLDILVTNGGPRFGIDLVYAHGIPGGGT